MEQSAIAARLREKVIAQPEVILEDRDVMRALVAANERAMGDNVVDMRGLAMERLEQRLDRLEDTHRTVLAAAYENLSGMNQVNRAVLRLLEPTDFVTFLRDLEGPVSEILRLDCLRVVIESHEAEGAPGLGRLGNVLKVVEADFVEDYLSLSRRAHRPVILRAMPICGEEVYGQSGLGSEALMRLDLGPGRLPGLLALASNEPEHFHPAQATDLLAFFAGVFERAMQRWLA